MNFRKASNTCLVIAIAIFLAFPAASIIMNSAGLALPDWMGVGMKGSVLELRTYTTMPELSKNSVASGEYQTQFEKFLSDHMPMRNEVVIMNAAVQRTLIEIANSPKGYDCYPTYYGSTKLYTPRIEALSYLPIKLGDREIANACGTLAGLQELASDYPNTQFIVCVVQGGQFAAVNPAYKYLQDITTGDDLGQMLVKSLQGKADNVSIFTTAYDSEEEYYSEFFRTDHHWNSQGALSAFNAMSKVAGIPCLNNPKRTDFPDDRLAGSIARWGLCLHFEPIFDLGGDGEGLTVINPDGSREPYSHSKWLNSDAWTRTFTFHDLYYEFIKSGSIVENSNANRSALLVCDSYGVDLVPMLGENYHTLHFMKDMHGDSKIDMTSSLRSHLEENTYDCVYIVAGCSNFVNQSRRSPNYFR